MNAYTFFQIMSLPDLATFSVHLTNDNLDVSGLRQSFTDVAWEGYSPSEITELVQTIDVATGVARISGQAVFEYAGPQSQITAGGMYLQASISDAKYVLWYQDLIETGQNVFAQGSTLIDVSFLCYP